MRQANLPLDVLKVFFWLTVLLACVVGIVAASVGLKSF
jgi:hypothetical protein